jgi:hypothetical protein
VAGYSGTPLAKKLGIKEGHRVAFPAGWLREAARKGGLWIAWPKASSGVETDLKFTDVQELGLASKLVDNKVCAIDETWSGVRMVIRLKDR